MLSKAILSVAFAASSVLGSPLITPRGAQGQIAPSAIFNYHVSTGAIQCEPAKGLISKNIHNNGRDITTLLTFTYPQASAGKKCQFRFSLTEADSLSGSQKIDLYTSSSPAPGCTSGWGPGNQRNIHLGRLSAVFAGTATWDATYSSYLTQPTDCKAPGTVEGFELVGVYDNDLVEWNNAVSGARIIYT